MFEVDVGRTDQEVSINVDVDGVQKHHYPHLQQRLEKVQAKFSYNVHAAQT